MWHPQIFYEALTHGAELNAERFNAKIQKLILFCHVRNSPLGHTHYIFLVSDSSDKVELFSTMKKTDIWGLFFIFPPKNLIPDFFFSDIAGKPLSGFQTDLKTAVLDRY